MDLLCNETECDCKAYPDPVLLGDERVLQNLLRTEERYAPSGSYFSCVQSEITPEMRTIVAEWMLEVCEEQKRQEEVFLLAVNYMDRFLSVCNIRKTQLQLLGTTCLLLSSKLRESLPFSAKRLVFYTDNSITLDDLWRWELLVLSKLKWDLSAVTPQDFLAHILRRLPLSDLWDADMVQRHAQIFIALCARDFKFSLYTPSIIAAASIAAALHGLGWSSKSGYTLRELLELLHRITAIEIDYLQGCLTQIDEMVTMNSQGMATSSDISGNGNQVNVSSTHPANTRPPDHPLGSSGADKILESGKAGTPTDVHDVHF
ncbi:G1/S-specific cyclin-E [Gryllus bimaculatus]|nr:G1/S-specific cyclin-E [Gryllus bimaculatus]